MNEKTYRRLFCETPRQTLIRHNFPYLNRCMTKAERKQHKEAVAEQGAEKVPKEKEAE